MITLTIPMEPQPMQRPRVTRHGKFTRTYIPDESVSAKTLIAYHCRKEITEKGIQPFRKPTPVSLSATFYRKRSAKLAKKITKPATRPDIVNYIALLADALEGYAYEDDGQITSLEAYKEYADVPKIVVTIKVD